MINGDNNIRFDKVNINKFLANEVNDNEKKQIANIFDASNTEKDTNGQIDNVLKGTERETFLQKIETALPKLYQKLVDFYTVVDVTENLQEKTDNKVEQENTQNIDNE